MYPDTRGWISTWSTASRRPVNSSHSVTSRSGTSATVTACGGGAAGGFFPPPTFRAPSDSAARERAARERPPVTTSFRVCMLPPVYSFPSCLHLLVVRAAFNSTSCYYAVGKLYNGSITIKLRLDKKSSPAVGPAPDSRGFLDSAGSAQEFCAVGLEHRTANFA